MKVEIENLTEQDAIKMVAVRIAEQNALVLNSIVEMTKSLMLLAEQLGHPLEREQIVIPAPLVTVEAAKLLPNISTTAPDVIVNIPLDKTRKTKGNFTRDKNGRLSGWESTTE